MFNIDSRHNIELFTKDNAILDFNLCGEELKEGDKVIFITDEQSCEVTTFDNGVAKIYIQAKDEPCNTCYHIDVEMKDGRKATIIKGKYVRKGCFI